MPAGLGRLNKPIVVSPAGRESAAGEQASAGATDRAFSRCQVPGYSRCRRLPVCNRPGSTAEVPRRLRSAANSYSSPSRPSASVPAARKAATAPVASAMPLPAMSNAVP